MSYSPRVLPDGSFALLSLIVGGATYWMLGLGSTQLHFPVRLAITLLLALITLFSLVPASVMCHRWGQHKPWVLIASIPTTAATWILLFGVIVAPVIKVAPFRTYFGENTEVEEALFVSSLALTIFGVIAVVLGTYSFSYSKPARTWAKVATVIACALFAATVRLLPLG
jgi:hypothetical protein